MYQESKLKAARMSLYVRRGGPNYQKGLARMRALAEEVGIPIEVHTISPLHQTVQPLINHLINMLACRFMDLKRQ